MQTHSELEIPSQLHTVGAPLVSLLVCTYNRASVLGPTLESLLGQVFDLGSYEIIVIDNASTDDTREVVEAYTQQDYRVRYVHEPRLGVAIARNTGAHLSKAEYIAYFDDDLVAEPDCLRYLLAPFFEQNPKPKAVMGKVDLLWEGGRPVWFPEQHETLLSKFDRGDSPRFMTSDEYLLTMNVAFNRQTFLQAGGIREDLSRKGRMFICGGDTEIFQRFMTLGHPIFYEPKAVVGHLVPASRQTREWLLKRLLGDGATQVILGAPRKKKWNFLVGTFQDIRRSLRFSLEIIYGKLRHNNALAEEGTYKLYQRAGRLLAHWNLLIGNDPRATTE